MTRLTYLAICFISVILLCKPFHLYIASIQEFTDEGKDIAKRILKGFSNGTVGILKRKRKAWDQLGYYGIL